MPTGPTGTALEEPLPVSPCPEGRGPAPGAEGGETHPRLHLTIAAGPVAGPGEEGLRLAWRLCAILTREGSERTRCAIVSEPNPKTRLAGLRSGDFDAALVRSDRALAAYRGSRGGPPRDGTGGEEGPFEALRGIARMMALPVRVLRGGGGAVRRGTPRPGVDGAGEGFPTPTGEPHRSPVPSCRDPARDPSSGAGAVSRLPGEAELETAIAQAAARDRPVPVRSGRAPLLPGRGLRSASSPPDRPRRGHCRARGALIVLPPLPAGKADRPGSPPGAHPGSPLREVSLPPDRVWRFLATRADWIGVKGPTGTPTGSRRSPVLPALTLDLVTTSELPFPVARALAGAARALAPPIPRALSRPLPALLSEPPERRGRLVPTALPPHDALRGSPAGRSDPACPAREGRPRPADRSGSPGDH